jgi:predicted RNA binding protein YcfA (HicA-like mRNA interferase family)
MPFSGKELVKIFRENGWLLDRIKGSHHIMVNPLTGETVPIPVHVNRSLKKGLERALLKKLRTSQ